MSKEYTINNIYLKKTINKVQNFMNTAIPDHL